MIFWFCTKLFAPSKLIIVPHHWGVKTLRALLVILLVIGGIHGKFSQFNLRWGEIFFAEDRAMSILSLNPILYFSSTLKFSTNALYQTR